MRREGWRLAVGLSLLGAFAAGCAAPVPKGSYRVLGRTYTPLPTADGYVETGVASWYGADFHGRLTSNGEVYDMYDRTCAHKLLPLGTEVRITNLANGRSALARVNDRGPFVDGRVVDLSYTLAAELDLLSSGTAPVRVEAVAGPRGAPPPTSALGGAFTCQVGAFSEATRAAGLARTLKERFADVAVVVYDRGDAVLYRVQVGTFAAPAQAQPTLAALRSRGFDPFLVRAD